MNKKNIVSIKCYESPLGRLILGSLGDELCLCDWEVEKHREFVDRRLKCRLNVDFDEVSSPVIEVASMQLDEYFAGRRRVFSVPLLFAGTDFQKAVWRELISIPYGATISYGEMARRLGRPNAVRAVANANGANAISIFVPCHRVIGGDGALTGYSGGLAVKRALLEIEDAL